MKVCIDDVLPEEFSLLVGKYVQTCAHIEKLCWQNLGIAKGIDWRNSEQLGNLIKVRKQTTPLLKELKNICSSLPPELSQEMNGCIAEIEAGIESRHMMVHGAWSVGSEKGKYTLDYFARVGIGKDSQWRHFLDEAYSMDNLRQAVAAADAILIRCAKLQMALMKFRPDWADPPAGASPPPKG